MAEEEPKNLFRLEDVQFSYQLDKSRVQALRGVTLDIRQKSFLCLTGPSGSGKTTLLSLLGLIEPIQEGRIWFEGHSFHELQEKERNRLRKFKIGFIFQSFNLNPVLNALENVEFFLARQGVEKSERQRRVEEALTGVGLWEHRRKKPLEMSGGQRQRVAMARALAKKPDVLIADEPTASLDQTTGRGIMELFTEMNECHGVSIIVSSHDPMVLSYTKQRIHLCDGLLKAP